MNPQSELKLATEAARTAGNYLKEARRQLVEIVSDAGRDLKVRADREAEEIILRALAPSGLAVLAEESGQHGSTGAAPYWVVDPLDGTLNFSRALPLCCVSIGLWREAHPVLGVVYDFVHDELFAAIVGKGARCNGTPISVSAVHSASQAVLATGFPVNRDFAGEALAEFVARVQAFKKVRLLGSAALSLAYVACGRIDAYAEDGIMFWDVAAGIALVKAAGGCAEVEDSPTLEWGKNVRCAAHPHIWAPERRA